MSYDLEFDCGPLPDDHDIRGGTFAMHGTTSPCLNITYNYASHFAKFLGEDGIRSLYGKTAAEVIVHTEKAISQMVGSPSDDYWDATEGNAKAALTSLRDLAILCPKSSILSGD